jgi:hypothetical protein
MWKLSPLNAEALVTYFSSSICLKKVSFCDLIRLQDGKENFPLLTAHDVPRTEVLVLNTQTQVIVPYFH